MFNKRCLEEEEHAWVRRLRQTAEHVRMLERSMLERSMLETYAEHDEEEEEELLDKQVRMLERSFEAETSSSERKKELARRLGMEPRQVAMWFQNRRARWKNKRLERDFDNLRDSYDNLRAQLEGVSDMANITMDAASGDRVDIKSESSVLEHMILDASLEPTNVSLALLQHITEDFDDKRQIGRGGFGVVYKGDLQNGSVVAVKRLLNSHTIDEKLFYREAVHLIGVKHENIVRLLAYCANTETKAMANPNPGETTNLIFAEIRERLLCFEYMMNGSLDKYLTDELRGLEWHTRFNIIKGICNGLDYLHNEKSIVHRDMKPANILVDDLMVPKITDFGISKLLDGATHTGTKTIAMSFGYSAPELLHGVVSFKSDIYSLGVIIMELVTGRKDHPNSKNVLRRWRHRWNKSGKYPPLGYQQVTKCIEIASTCRLPSPNKRPHVRDILRMLNAIESTDVQINGAGESLLGQIRPYPWELLEFDKLELSFPFEISKHIPCSLELTNVTDAYAAFDVQSTGMLEYTIAPNKGVLPAQSKCIVIVTLQPREAAPHDTMCSEEFIVRCAAVNGGITAEDIHDDMFDNKSAKLVDEVTLTVVI